MGAAEDELIGIPFPEHSNELLHSLNEQRRKGLLCDLTIVAQGLEYQTHRAVLAACSQYFRKLFTARPFRGQRDVCELDFVRPRVLGALLEFAYTATLTVSSSDMREVLQAARLLEIQCVTDACADILQSSGASEPPQPTPDPPAIYAGASLYPEGPAQEDAAAVSAAADLQTLEVPKVRRRKRPKKPPRLSLNHRGRSLYRIVQPLQTSMDTDAELDRRQPEACLGEQESSPGAGGHQENEGDGSFLAEEGGGPSCHQLAPSSSPLLPLAGDEESAELPASTYLSLVSNGLLSDGALSALDRAPGTRRRKSQMPQECPICHKVIHGAGKLPRHIRTHTGEKPFACQVCGVRFTRNDKLKIHMRKHTGERPYSCTCCDARFLHSYDLKNHARLHTGDRPFECSQCRKAFVRIDHLQRHLKGQNCLEIRTRKRRGDSQGPQEHLVNWEHSGMDGTFPEDYRIERETPGMDCVFPEGYRIKRETHGIDGAFPEEYGIEKETLGIDSAFPEDYGIKREPSGTDRKFPEGYGIKRESPGIDGAFPEDYGIKREPSGTDRKFPEGYGIRSESPGIDGAIPEGYGIKKEPSGADRNFPEGYGIKRESPGIDGAIPEGYGIKKEPLRISRKFPEGYRIKKEPLGIDCTFPEGYRIRGAPLGLDGTFPERYRMTVEPPQTEGDSDQDNLRVWGHSTVKWNSQPGEDILVDPS
ncbi:zinc finger and BTB domain-containing protein 7B-like [Chiloscyllium punctatum]|uniref:Zinc finger and BTB domain-containing protein 7A n=1 Tax=Chiloscyllium punctatum TaxID=137246 RepID=A0A401RJK6_CHIPU|nr:hypothetical protein [Chiloscyllium punctatum]